jgi:hypothetical protein
MAARRAAKRRRDSVREGILFADEMEMERRREEERLHMVDEEEHCRAVYDHLAGAERERQRLLAKEEEARHLLAAAAIKRAANVAARVLSECMRTVGTACAYVQMVVDESREWFEALAREERERAEMGAQPEEMERRQRVARVEYKRGWQERARVRREKALDARSRKSLQEYEERRSHLKEVHGAAQAVSTPCTVLTALTALTVLTVLTVHTALAVLTRYTPYAILLTPSSTKGGGG